VKKLAATFAALAIFAGSSAAAHAGVVVTEQEVIDQGTGSPVTHSRTVMIQGNKQKMVTDRAQVVTDLDNGTMYLMNPVKKQYVEVPFPPQGPMAQIMSQRMSTLSFKKTGGSKTVSGFACQEYTGAGSMMGNEYTVTGCFSTKAPGASDFDAFQKTMANKVKGTAMAMKGEVPDGVPIELDSTTKMTNFSMPGMSPDQAAKLKQMFAKRPPVVSKTTVIKIASKELSADTFKVPSDFSKQEMPAGGPMGGPATAPSPASPQKSAD